MTKMKPWVLALILLGSSHGALASSAEGTRLAELTYASLECSMLAPNRNEEARLLKIGREAALEFFIYAREGREIDFDSAAGPLASAAIHTYPSDDFQIGILYAYWQEKLDDYLGWAEEHLHSHKTSPRDAEFKKRNCALISE